MIEYLIDTSAVIEYRRKNKKAYERFDEADVLYLPVIALGELYYGSFHAKYPQRSLNELKELLPVFTIIHASEQTARIFGQLKSDLRKAGTLIPENDVWIAAFALEHDLPLIGRDVHFEWVSRLDYRVLQ